MRLHIEHATRYLYTRPVGFGRHRLVLRPREGHDLRVERLELQLEPSHEVTWIRDVFGNSIAIVDWLEPAAELTIVSHALVQRLTAVSIPDQKEPWRVAFPPQYEPLEAAITHVYQARSYPEDSMAVDAWLREVLTTNLEDAQATMAALCEVIFRHVSYRRRLDRGVQSPARTLEVRTGSCRDSATLMMEAARGLGVAARFASGYLHCAASIAGRGSMHAWAEVYLPTLGWRGFDPSTGAAIGINHIVTGVSSHPRGVMPVSGAFAGGPDDYKTMIVTVKTEEIVSTPLLVRS